MTNNPRGRVAGYGKRRARLGVEAAEDEVLTSALATADLLAADLAPGARILACSGPGVVEALQAKGFDVVDAGQPDPGPAEAVVVGRHRTLDFARLRPPSAPAPAR